VDPDIIESLLKRENVKIILLSVDTLDGLGSPYPAVELTPLVMANGGRLGRFGA
jgi:hypothetical protein